MTQDVEDYNHRPRSSIDLELEKTHRKSISLPQSTVVTGALKYLKRSLGAKAKESDPVPMPSSIPEYWCPNKVTTDKLIKAKFYQSHNESFPTDSAATLDEDASRIGITLTGNVLVPSKNQEINERQSTEIIRLLSHADLFCYSAFKCLQQEDMDSRVLQRILESLANSIMDGLAMFQTCSIMQTRREIALNLAHKYLTDIANGMVKLTVFLRKL